ncbi:MAG TPA: hypothetical protein GX717_06830 [Clostridiaceae bacterium]|nr:hypothetical protein [Clostridiaceae bacterium]
MKPIPASLLMTNDCTSKCAQGVAQLLIHLDNCRYRIVLISLQSPKEKVEKILLYAFYSINRRAIRIIQRRAPPQQNNSLSALMRRLHYHNLSQSDFGNYLIHADLGILFVEPFMRGDSLYNFSSLSYTKLWHLVHSYCCSSRESTVPVIITDLHASAIPQLYKTPLDTHIALTIYTFAHESVRGLQAWLDWMKQYDAKHNILFL